MLIQNRKIAYSCEVLRKLSNRPVLKIHLLLFLIFVQWSIMFKTQSPLTDYLFFIGPFIGAGILLSLIADITDTATFVFISISNSILFYMVVGFISVLIGRGNYNPEVFFNILFILYSMSLLISGYLCKQREEIITISRPSPYMIKYAFLAFAALILCFISPQLIATNRTEWFSLFAYFLILSLVIIRIFSDQKSPIADLLLIVIIGLGLIWLRVLTTQDVLVFDGRLSMRFSKMALQDGIGSLPDIRIANMAVVQYVLPTLTIFSQSSIYWVVKWIMPVIASTSLVGIFVFLRFWFSSYNAIFAVFLIGIKSAFYAGVPGNLRSAIALLFVVATFICLMTPSVQSYRTGKRIWFTYGCLYLLAIMASHDTVGIVVIILLLAYSGITFLSQIYYDFELSYSSLAVSFTIIAVALYYSLYHTGPSFYQMAQLGAYTILEYAGFVESSYETQQSVGDSFAILNSTFADLLLISSILLEVFLMVFGTIYIGLNYIMKKNVLDPGKQQIENLQFEILTLSASIVFGILILLPILAARRVYLYLSPLLVSLVIIAIRQVTATCTSRYNKNQENINKIMMSLLIVFLMVNQVGFIFYATGASGVDGPHTGSTNVDDYMYQNTDVSARDWIGLYVPKETEVFGDYFAQQFLRSDLRIDLDQIHFIEKDVYIDDLPDNSCVFIRSYNKEYDKLFINDPQQRIREGLNSEVNGVNLVYSSGESAVVC